MTVEFVEQIMGQLSGDQTVSRRLDGEGYLHIERQLPYLCVYRQPDGQGDEGSANLVKGQAAYLIASGRSAERARLSEWVLAIATAQSECFQGFLVVELWSAEDVGDQSGHPVAPVFHIHAPRGHVPTSIVEGFVNALQEVHLRSRHARVELSYDGVSHPPGLAPLLSDEQAASINCVVLGVEIKPVYRDPDTHSVLPFALRAMRRGVTHALKKGFFHFSHDQTAFRPSHYHELGSRALTQAVWDVDRRLADISDQFDLLLHVTPVNAEQAWRAFEQSGYGAAPEFHYRPRSADPALLKRNLYHVPIEHIEDPTLADLFESKRDELDRQITLLNDRNTPQFLHGSIQLFGQVDGPLLQTARTVLSHVSDQRSADSGETLDAEGLAQCARQLLDRYRETDPSLSARVEVRDDVTGILVSHGNFLIGRDARVSRARLGATLNHEIGTHVLTYHNGKAQPFQLLHSGMAGYEELQEGLAVFAEYVSGGLGLPRLQLLAGRVIAVHSIMGGADFVETYRLLNGHYGFRAFTAYTIAMRVYRGGGYTKDMIYLRGFMRLLDYLVEHDTLELMYCGKIAMDHLPLMEELRWRKVLTPITLLPGYLQTGEAREKMANIRSGETLESIVGGL